MTPGRYTDLWRGIAREDPDRVAVVSTDRRLSFGQFHDDASSLAASLDRSGVRPGDSVAIYCHNRPEFLTALYACLATGLAPVPINFRYRPAELSELLADCRARALIYPSSLAGVVAEAVHPGDQPPVLIQIDDGGELLPGASAYDAVVAEPGVLPEVPPPGGELRLYTGGTTGRPRAVLWDSDRLFEGKVFSTYTLVGVDIPDTVADAVAVALDPATPHVVTLPLAPFVHGTALFTSLNTLALGGTVVVHASPRLDAAEALRLIHDEEVTRLVIAGDAVALPVLTAAEDGGTGLGGVSSILSSGMRLSDEVKGRLHELADVTIVDLLAATEGGPFATGVTTSAGDLPTRLRLRPDAAILDSRDTEVQGTVGALGRLAFRGALPKGYLGDEQKTRETFRDIGGHRYVVPGDWARVVDADGHIELLGRGSAVVNTGGEKVYPGEVEQALLEHPAVADVVVLGIPDRRFGEAVTALVVPAAGAHLDQEALTAHVDGRLAGYKKPRHILIRESLHRSPHGKLDLRVLQQEATRELEVASR